jgi:hypothetical protein
MEISTLAILGGQVGNLGWHQSFNHFLSAVKTPA